MSTTEHAPPKRRGRPLKPEADRKTATMKFRVTSEVRKQIEEASANSGRSLSDEIEIRLRNSFLLQPLHQAIYQNGDCLRELVLKLLAGIPIIQDYADANGHKGTREWDKSEGTRAAIRAAASIILQHAAPLSPPSDIQAPPGQRSPETEEILWMRELGKQVGCNLTGQIGPIVDMMMRHNDAKQMNNPDND